MASRPETSSPAAPSALSWGDIMDREDPLPSSPPSSTLSWGDIMDVEDPLPSSPPPLSALSWGDIMDAEDPLPSSPPTTSAPTWGEIMDAEDPLPSSPPTASAFRWGEVMNAEDVKIEEREKQKEQSKKVVQQEKSEDFEEQKMMVKVISERKIMIQEVEQKKENVKASRERKEQIQEAKEKKEHVKVIRKQKKEIQEVEERKKQAKKHQQLPDKTTESSVDKSCHSKNTKTLELFIKNLDYSVDDKRLYKEFVPFGAIISAKVMMENGRSKGFGYITFSCVREAMAAMSEMDGVTLARRRIYISLSKSRKEPKPYPAQTEQRTGSSQPTKPRLSPEKETRRVRPQRPLYVVPARLERKKENK